MEALGYSDREAATLARRECDAMTERTPTEAVRRRAIGPTTRTASTDRDMNDPGARNVIYEQLVEAYRAQARGWSKVGPTC